ncbi:MAG: aminotransferase class V-fold PLP-dependent enzyme [Anaerolineaceae bacterium]|nr:aminotransferase class V-fold PLP-dependent enzyme [Anaerolineaceae bacterium]MCB9098257.1 aminotransferase class V-fold PLP-dependent enzyme [Anaerolineales bacterium]
MNNLVKTLINQMSITTGTALTDEHLRVLEYAYSFYEKNRVGPLYQNIKRHTGVTKETIEQLFPYGLNSVYTWVGIPIYSADKGCKPFVSIAVDNAQQVYLDYNGTTPLRPEIVQVLSRYQSDSVGFGNASSSTTLGKHAYDLVYKARRQLADCLSVSAEEIIFTGSGSEANNLALKGLAFQHLAHKGHIIASEIEHPSVLRTLEFLQQLGFVVTYLRIEPDGHISPQVVKDHLRPNTLLVSIMAANNEIGVINPLAEIGQICQAAGVPFMVDAVQGFGKIPLRPKSLGISLLSMSGHKIYAPKGVGALFVDKSITLTPLVHGGGQEFGLRAGTENVGAIIALGHAARLAHTEMKRENERLLRLRNFFLAELQRIVPDVIVNGSLEHRLANNLNVGFPDIDSGSLLLSLNQIGVYVSAGSACSAGSRSVSHVISALSVDTERYGIIRFSFGLQTTQSDLEYLLNYLPQILNQL